MFRSLYLFIVFLLVTGCSRSKSGNAIKLTLENKKAIELFAQQLVKSINDYDYTLIRNSWSNEAFGKRVKDLNRVQRNVFNYIFEKEIKDEIKFTNISLVNHVNSEKGKIYISNIEHFNSHSEITLLSIFDNNYNFIIYRVEMINGKPYLCDFFDLKSGIWYSEAIKNVINLNSRYDMFSEERRTTNLAWNNSNLTLRKGDTLNALYYLYEIPKTHWVGSGLSLMKLNLAQSVSDSIYAQVLETEFEYDQSLYLKYLYYRYWNDSINLSEVYITLKHQTGEDLKLDSLIANSSFWR
ncbi:MAG: hypothetical protein COW03_02850 [Cytophagales bacterium CG12_big_fil_rev_8_21_14_0_65_40_12]|nr:MAG: hypothetical protein COW03_02850 [Cytophagales bacterium CG12_big_fil_rev_8_21_14_0_65_40_12]PIW03481.1 MAG: hypothetical protein COW40_15095 [Cytophagales bacterium CG17_big_fil_post_rev_8_21_14_2_50_40_13]